MKKFVVFLLTILLCCNIAVPVFAMDESNVTGAEANSVEPRTEEFKWYYRYNNGVYEYRIWSITESEWVTEWTPVSEIET